ncbi:unnamed protein product [Strongylus vulgaris]|uniref:Uncharacterized protein n=1 Tax=Strongylus vulgaris TaxID=40348 RepID=A0A3P7IQ52_STRVU|nr:unnamed protein product [Strongylus vulgaris]
MPRSTGSRYTNPYRSVAAFTRCPSILRSVTSKNAYRWNTVHVQLPPGTTHVSRQESLLCFVSTDFDAIALAPECA